VRGDCEIRQRTCRQASDDPVAATIGFEDRFGQLFDKQRHAIGALDDLFDGSERKAGIACELFHQHRAVAPGESVQV